MTETIILIERYSNFIFFLVKGKAKSVQEYVHISVGKRNVFKVVYLPLA